MIWNFKTVAFSDFIDPKLHQHTIFGINLSNNINKKVKKNCTMKRGALRKVSIIVVYNNDPSASATHFPPRINKTTVSNVVL